MGYTKRKIREINFSFFLAAVIFAGWALVCAWYGWPRGYPHGSEVAFGLLVLTALFFTAFPLIWARFPEKHPVNHELARYGNLAEISARLDHEMTGRVETLGPFRFSATMLVYDSGHEFQLVPYDRIATAEIDQPSGDEAPAIVVKTRSGKRYQWYRTWMQGRFDPDLVLEKIRVAAHLEATLPQPTNLSSGSNSCPSTASQSPSTAGSRDSAQSRR